MTSTEKPGFFSSFGRLFGRNVTKPSSDNEATTIQSIPSASEASRKRPLESPQGSSLLENGLSYLSNAAKRFRGSASLAPEPVVLFDATSSSNLSYSPGSHALGSHLTHSSNKTASLLGQIEKATSPAKDARRKPLLKNGLDKSRWGSNTAKNPPLKRLNQPIKRISTTGLPSHLKAMPLTPMPERRDAPSRFAVFGASSVQNKPYWRDVSFEKEVSEAAQAPSKAAPSAPIVALDENGENSDADIQPPTPSTEQADMNDTSVYVVKSGSNKFSANAICNGEAADKAVVKAKNDDQPKFTFAPPITKKVKPSFSFKKPIKITEVFEESESDFEDDSVIGKTEDKAKCDRSADAKTKQANEPVTVAATKKAGVPAPVISSTPSIPAPAKSYTAPAPAKSSTAPAPAKSTAAPIPAQPIGSSTKWECPSCMITNKNTDMKCVACEEPKPGSAPSSSSTNVFGAKAFKPTTTPSSTSGFSFGLGTSSCSTLSFGVKPSENGATKSTTASSEPSFTPSFGIKPATVNETSKTATGSFSFGVNTESASATASSTTCSAFGSSTFKVPTPLFGSSTSTGTATVSTSTSTASSIPRFGGASTGSAAPFIFGAASTSASPATFTFSKPVKVTEVTEESSSDNSTEENETTINNQTMVANGPVTAAPAPTPSQPVAAQTTTTVAPISSSAVSKHTTSAPSAGLFSFGSATSSTPSFGSGLGPVNVASKPTFSFGAKAAVVNSTTSSTATAPSFGSSAFKAPQPAIFGAPKNGSTKLTASGFGAPTASSSTFGSSAFNVAKASPFGAASSGATLSPPGSSTKPAPSAFVFGSNAASVPSSSSVTASKPTPFGSSLGGATSSGSSTFSAAPALGAPLFTAAPSPIPRSGSASMFAATASAPPPNASGSTAIPSSFAFGDLSSSTGASPNPFAFSSSASSGQRKMLQPKRKLRK